jgi:hypothetical protein
VTERVPLETDQLKASAGLCPDVVFRTTSSFLNTVIGLVLVVAVPPYAKLLWWLPPVECTNGTAVDPVEPPPWLGVFTSITSRALLVYNVVVCSLVFGAIVGTPSELLTGTINGTVGANDAEYTSFNEGQGAYSMQAGCTTSCATSLTCIGNATLSAIVPNFGPSPYVVRTGILSVPGLVETIVLSFKNCLDYLVGGPNLVISLARSCKSAAGLSGSKDDGKPQKKLDLLLASAQIVLTLLVAIALLSSTSLVPSGNFLMVSTLVAAPTLIFMELTCLIGARVSKVEEDNAGQKKRDEPVSDRTKG